MHPNDVLNGRRVLVVGGAGYVGAVLVPHLLSYGAEVVILDNLIYGNGFAVQHLLETPELTFVRGDFGDVQRLRHELATATDVVLLASLVGDSICNRYPDLAVRTNRDSSCVLQDELADSNVDRYILASTCSNYGIKRGEDLATESSKLNPQSLYAETKVEVERHLLSEARDSPVASTVLRIATLYGLSPRMRFDLSVSHFTRALASGEALEVYDPYTWRPYCHIRDLAEAIVVVLLAPKEDVRAEVFNVGSDDQHFTKRMLVEEVAKHVAPVRVAYREGDTDPRDYRVNFLKMKKVLGFSPTRTVQSYLPLLVEALDAGVFAELQHNSRKFGNYEIEGSLGGR